MSTNRKRQDPAAVIVFIALVVVLIGGAIAIVVAMATNPALRGELAQYGAQLADLWRDGHG